MSEAKDIILDVIDLKMYFPVTRGLMRKKVADVKAVDGVTFKLKRGETLGLVGESGCGKTTVARCIIHLYQPTSGKIIFEGQDISNMRDSEFRPLHREISIIFQDPFSSLDPRQNVERIVGEPIRIHRITRDKKDSHEKIAHLLQIVGLDPGLMSRLPHELSGGQRQRVAVARALACDPSLIVCDEPISALDVSIQAQVINLLQDLKEGLKGLTYIFIAHDISVIKHISNRIAVMYLGHIVEITTPRELYRNPLHPYTRALLSAVPVPDPDVEEGRERIILQGEVPSPLNPPKGCCFHTRCFNAMPECNQTTPQLREVGGHEVACIRV